MCQRVSVIQWNPAFLSQQQTQLRYSPPQPSSIESPHSEISDSQPASPKTQFRNVLSTAQTELDNNRLLIKQINSFGLKRLFNQQAVTQPTLPKKRMKSKLFINDLVSSSSSRKRPHSETFWQWTVQGLWRQGVWLPLPNRQLWRMQRLLQTLNPGVENIHL